MRQLFLPMSPQNTVPVDRQVASFGWRALTDVPTSLVIQLRELSVSKQLVRESEQCSKNEVVSKKCLLDEKNKPSGHQPLGTKLLHTVFLFWGIIFGNYYRKLYSISFLGALMSVM